VNPTTQPMPAAEPVAPQTNTTRIGSPDGRHTSRIERAGCGRCEGVRRMAERSARLPPPAERDQQPHREHAGRTNVYGHQALTLSERNRSTSVPGLVGVPEIERREGDTRYCSGDIRRIPEPEAATGPTASHSGLESGTPRACLAPVRARRPARARHLKFVDLRLGRPTATGRSLASHRTVGSPGARPPEQIYRNGPLFALSATTGPPRRGGARRLLEPRRRGAQAPHSTRPGFSLMRHSGQITFSAGRTGPHDGAGRCTGSDITHCHLRARRRPVLDKFRYGRG
jgi:hypothetical protein